MISAKDAKVIALKNPTFERKTQLYKDVSDRIENAAAEGKRHIWLSDEEHYALHKELAEKGYTHGDLFIVVTGLNTHPHRYDF